MGDADQVEKAPAPAGISRGINPDQEQEIADRIRSAYDRGYNDARNASSVPGDNAASYRGRDMSAEITVELLAGLRRLSTPNKTASLLDEDLTYHCDACSSPGCGPNCKCSELCDRPNPPPAPRADPS